MTEERIRNLEQAIIHIEEVLSMCMSDDPFYCAGKNCPEDHLLLPHCPLSELYECTFKIKRWTGEKIQHDL